MTTDLLKKLTHSFELHRPKVSKAIREFYASDPETFIASACVVLRDSGDNPGTRFLLATLILRHDLLLILCNPNAFTTQQSAALIRQAKNLDPRIELKLANLVAGLAAPSEKAASLATHCLEVLSELSEDAAALPALRELLQCRNPRIRSKAALLIGHISRNPQWAKSKDMHQDPRVGANAMESIWGLDTPAAKDVFRAAADADEPRHAINGAVGLHLAREMEAVTLLFRFARDERADFRAAAAWGMGRTGDPRFLKALIDLEKDFEESVKTSAAQALAVLHRRLEILRRLPAIPLQIALATFQKGEHAVHIELGEESVRLHLDALHFAISSGAALVEEFTFAQVQPAEAALFEFRFNGPQASSRIVKVEMFTERGCGEGAGIELANRSSRFPRSSGDWSERA